MNYLLFTWPLLLFCGCTITTINISQKTALENQLLGEMAPLSDEELLLSSVRARGAPGSSLALTPAIAARRRQLFNRDDTNEFKKQRCVGERSDALLVPRPCSQREDPVVERRLQKLVTEENHDRKLLVDWTISNDPTLTPADRPEIQRLYHTLLTRNSPEGTLTLNDAGTWAPKEAPGQPEQR